MLQRIELEGKEWRVAFTEYLEARRFLVSYLQEGDESKQKQSLMPRGRGRLSGSFAAVFRFMGLTYYKREAFFGDVKVTVFTDPLDKKSNDLTQAPVSLRFQVLGSPVEKTFEFLCAKDLREKNIPTWSLQESVRGFDEVRDRLSRHAVEGGEVDPPSHGTY